MKELHHRVLMEKRKENEKEKRKKPTQNEVKSVNEKEKRILHSHGIPLNILGSKQNLPNSDKMLSKQFI